MSALALYWAFLRAVLLSFSGFAAVPWLREAQPEASASYATPIREQSVASLIEQWSRPRRYKCYIAAVPPSAWNQIHVLGAADGVVRFTAMACNKPGARSLQPLKQRTNARCVHKESGQMNSRAALVAGLFASVLATVSCGEDVNSTPVAPTGPSSLSQLLQPRLSGNWGGELTLSGVTGGTGPSVSAGATGCDGASFAQVLGEKSQYTMSITQSADDLTANMVSASNGLACEYKGRVGSDKTFVLHAEQCTQKPLALLCRDGQSRELDLVGSSVTASFDDPVNPTTIKGSAAYTYNVKNAGTPVSSLVLTQSFSNLTRR